MDNLPFIKDVLQPTKQKLEEQNERLQNQIEICDDIIHNATLKRNENNIKLKEINHILEKIK